MNVDSPACKKENSELITFFKLCCYIWMTTDDINTEVIHVIKGEEEEFSYFG